MLPRSPQVLQRGLQQDPLYARHVRPDEELFLDVGACVVLYCESEDLAAVDATGAACKALALVRPAPDGPLGDLARRWRQRADALLAQAGRNGLRGIRQHRVLPGAASRMGDGAPLPDAPELVEELFFDSVAALQAFCAEASCAQSFLLHGARPPGQGSHLFAAQEHLVYDQP